MKIPALTGRNKIRDAKICALYADDNMTTEKIGELFKITPRRVRAILYHNREYLKLDKDWEKTKRIHKLKRLISKANPSRKDVADLLEQLRVEIEGNKVEHTGKVEHTHFIESIVNKAIPNRVIEYANVNQG